MAKRLSIPSKELQLKLVGSWGSFLASRVQRITLGTDIPSTVIDEIGSATHAGVITDIPNITLTFSAFDVGIKCFSVLTGTDPQNYPSEGVDIENLGEIDAILYVKDASVSDYVKSAHAKRLQIRDFTYTYSVDGESTEDYTAVGSEKRWFKNDVVVDKFTTGTTSFNLTETPIQLQNSNYGLSVILDGEYLEEVSTAPSTGEYRIVGTTLTTGDTRTAQVIAVYHANPAGSLWADVSDPNQAVAIRGKDVAVTISANSIPRVQSVTLNGSLNPQPVREMGTNTIVGYTSQVPVIEGELTVLDTDTELIDLIINGSINSGATEFILQDTCTASGIDLEIALRDPCNTSTVLKTVYVPEFVTVGDTYTSNVNDNAVQTFNFQSNTGQLIIYSGARP